MNLDNFFKGGISYIAEDLRDPRQQQSVHEFFSRPVEYKRQFSYGFGGYLERGYEHSGDPNMPDMQESYTITPGRKEPLPPELEFLYESLFKKLCQVGEEVVKQVVAHKSLKQCGLTVDDFEFSMLVNYFYPYDPGELEADRAFRMGEHIDEGLFTAMPHGAVYDFEAMEDGSWSAPKAPEGLQNGPIVFPGKLAQILSDGNIPALKHRVRLSEKKTARISYPFAALPKPGAELKPGGRELEMITGRMYMEQYLSEHINTNMEY